MMIAKFLSNLAKSTATTPELSQSALNEAVTALDLMANTDRLTPGCQLAQGEICFGELEEALDIRQPTLSQQLGVLRNEAVVSTRREGKNIYYSVADQRLLEMLSVLYRLYCPKE